MIHLEAFQEEDFDQLIGWVDSPEFLMRWAGPAFEHPLTREQLSDYIQNANHAQADALIYKVVDIESAKIIGHISLGKIDRKHDSARIGKVLVGDKSMRGHGIGEAMLRKVLAIAFNDLALNRVSLGVFDFNTPAIRLYEKVGFQKEGLLRRARKINGEYWNLCEMSILKHEWDEAN